MWDVFNTVRDRFFPKQQIQAPLRQVDVLDDPGIRAYVAQDVYNTTQARKNPGEVKLNKTLQYPESISNAPISSVKKVAQPQKAVKAAKTKRSSTNLERSIYEGLQRYSPNVPVGTASAALAQAGEEFQKRGLDPYIPTLVSLIETSGGRNFTRGQNNLYNVLANTGGVNYPDYETAILGGGEGGRQGFLGTILNSGYYKDYLRTKKLEDLLKVFTPPGAEHNNASMQRQLERYADLRRYFEQ